MPLKLSLHQILIIGLLHTFMASEASAQSITFLFENHPPFTYSENGKLQGTFIGPTEAAIRAAGFTVFWKERTFNRLKRELNEEDAPVCVTGHSVDENLKRKLRVTRPIGHFGKSGLLIRESNKEAFDELSSVQALFEETLLVGGFVKGATYAVSYEKYLPTSKAKHLIVASTHELLAQLVARGRLDFIFENELMVEVHKGMNGELGEQLTFVSLPGMPAARNAHIVCNKSVPQAWVDRLDAGIAANQAATSRE